MDAKLKIDLSQGVLEVEGSENLVNEIYQDFKQNLLLNLQASSSITTQTPSETSGIKKQSAPARSSKKKRKASSKTKTPALVKDLDLLGKGKAESLKTFVAPYEPKSAREWNLLFVYYLQKILEVPAIGTDHIYTCYKHVTVKPPTNLYQSLLNTAHRNGSINTASVDSITVTIVGENFVEHEMPRKDRTE